MEELKRELAEIEKRILSAMVGFGGTHKLSEPDPLEVRRQEILELLKQSERTSPPKTT